MKYLRLLLIFQSKPKNKLVKSKKLQSNKILHKFCDNYQERFSRLFRGPRLYKATGRVEKSSLIVFTYTL
jgi:hypothetical protein